MRKVKYSKDVDALLIELSDKPIDYAEEAGQFIVHFSKRRTNSKLVYKKKTPQKIIVKLTSWLGIKS